MELIVHETNSFNLQVGEAWGGQSGRRVVNACYDNIAEVQPDIIRYLLQIFFCFIN